MSTLLKPIQVRSKLLKQGVKIFTPQAFSRIFATNQQTTKYFLETQTLEGLFLRIKKGVYMLATDPPGEEEVANALYRPSYISFEYALAYFNILPEMTYTITSATTKSTRLFTVNNIAYSYRAIKKTAYTGYTLVNKENRSFLLAEPEKALIDYLYFVSLNRINSTERLVLRLNKQGKYKTKGLDESKINNYTKMFKNERLNKLVEHFL